VNLSKQRFQALKLKILEYGVSMRNLGLILAKHDEALAREYRYEADAKKEELLEDIALLYDRKPASELVKDDQSKKQEIL
jgi:hypothetical protein